MHGQSHAQSLKMPDSGTKGPPPPTNRATIAVNDDSLMRINSAQDPFSRWLDVLFRAHDTSLRPTWIVTLDWYQRAAK